MEQHQNCGKVPPSMTKSLRRLLAFLSSTVLAILVLAGPLGASAQFFGQPGSDLGVGVVQGYAPPARNLPATILGIINYVLILVGVLALAYLVYGGFRYITSRGDEGEVESAKGIITNAVIGIVVIGIAAALVNFVIGGILLGAR